MGGAGYRAKVGSFSQPNRAPLKATLLSTPKTSGCRKTSRERTQRACLFCGAGLLDEEIQSATLCVVGNMVIPKPFPAFVEPLAELEEISGGQMLDGAFDFFDRAHD